jgi:hypothetical protein
MTVILALLPLPGWYGILSVFTGELPPVDPVYRPTGYVLKHVTKGQFSFLVSR